VSTTEQIGHVGPMPERGPQMTRIGVYSVQQPAGAPPRNAGHAAPGGRTIGRAWWVGVLALAALLRIAWGALVPVVPLSDSNAYRVFAENLAAGHGYVWEVGGPPTAYWPVGTPAIYAMLFKIFGVSYAPIVAMNVALGVGIVALAMELARRWFGVGAARAAGLMLACWPVHVQFTSVLASEIPFTALLLAALLAWTALGAHPIRRGLLVGILVAGATYVRTTAMLLPIVLIGIELLPLLGASMPRELPPPRSPRNGGGPGVGDRVAKTLVPPSASTPPADRRWVRGTGAARSGLAGLVVITTMAALIAPWTLRNWRAFGEFVPVSTNRGSVLWMGNNPDTTGEYQLPPEMPHLNEAQWNNELGRMARAYILEKPGEFVLRTARKALKMHDRETIGVAWNEQGLEHAGVAAPGQNVLKAGSTLYWYGMLAAATAGIGALCRAPRSRLGPRSIALRVLTVATHPTVVIWAYFTAIHAIMLVSDRYHYPVTPMVAMLGGMGIVETWRRAAARRGEVAISHEHKLRRAA